MVGSRARDTDGGRTGWILTLNHTLSEEPSRDGGLALAQRQGMEALRHACVLCQLEQGILVGSTPGDRINMSGVRGAESSITCRQHRAWAQAEGRVRQWDRD